MQRFLVYKMEVRVRTLGIKGWNKSR